MTWSYTFRFLKVILLLVKGRRTRKVYWATVCSIPPTTLTVPMMSYI